MSYFSRLCQLQLSISQSRSVQLVPCFVGVHHLIIFTVSVVVGFLHIKMFPSPWLENIAGFKGCLLQRWKSCMGLTVLIIQTVKLSWRSVHTTPQLHCITALHPILHRNCNVTALQCHMKVKIILTYHILQHFSQLSRAYGVAAMLDAIFIFVWKSVFQ